jgi:GNAT superfamily N-acetyltransferase
MVSVRPVAQSDRAEWDVLYAGYAAFYGTSQTPQMRDTVWSWLMDPAHTTNGLVAEHGGRLIGLAHFRPYARPLSATTGGFLDDLFVDTGARGSGAAAALMKELSAIGTANGWSVIRWITAENNYRARGLYDQIATRTPWVTYDIQL